MTKITKVQVTREQKVAYDIQRFETVAEDESFTFVARFTENEIAKLKEKVVEPLNTRKLRSVKAAMYIIEEAVYHKVKITPSKTQIFTVTGLAVLPDAVTEISKQLATIMELDKFKPSQKILEELEN